MKSEEDDISIIDSIDFSQKETRDSSVISTVESYCQIVQFDALSPPNLIHMNLFTPRIIQKLKQEKIIHNPKFHSAQLKIEIIHASINKQVLLIQVFYGQFVQFISLLNVNDKNDTFLVYSKLVSKGRDNIAVFQYLNEMIAVKAFPYKNNNFGQKLVEAIKELFLLRIASVLETGPNIKNFFGFDILIYQDSIVFGMEYTPLNSNFNKHKMRNDLNSALKTNHSFKLIHQDIKFDNIGYSKLYKKYIFIDYGYSDIITEELGNRTMTGFKGTMQFCCDEMRHCYASQAKNLVDLYFNDAYCLHSTFLLMAVQLSYLRKYQDNQDQQDKKNLTLDYIIYAAKYILYFNIVHQKAINFLQNYKNIIKIPWLGQLIRFQKIIKHCKQYEFFWKHLLSSCQQEEQFFSYSNFLKGSCLQSLTQQFFQTRFNDFIKELANISFKIKAQSQISINIYYTSLSISLFDSFENSISDKDDSATNPYYLLECSKILDITNGEFTFEGKFKVASEFLLKNNKKPSKQKVQDISISLMILYEHCYQTQVKKSIRVQILKKIVSSIMLLQLINQEELLRGIRIIFNQISSIKEKLSIFLTFFTSKIWIESLTMISFRPSAIEALLFECMALSLQIYQPQTQQELFLLQIFKQLLWLKQNVRIMSVGQLHRWKDKLNQWKTRQLNECQMKFDVSLCLEYFQLIDLLLCQILFNLKSLSVSLLLTLLANHQSVQKNRQKQSPCYYHTSFFKALIAYNHQNMVIEIFNIFRNNFSPFHIFDKFYIFSLVNLMHLNRQLSLNIKKSLFEKKIFDFSRSIQVVNVNFKIILLKNLFIFMKANKIDKQIQKKVFDQFIFQNNTLNQCFNAYDQSQPLFHVHFLLTFFSFFIEIVISYSLLVAQLNQYLLLLQCLIEKQKCHICKEFGMKHMNHLYFFFLIANGEVEKAFQLTFLDIINKIKSNQTLQSAYNLLKYVKSQNKSLFLLQKYDLFPLFKDYLLSTNKFAFILTESDLFLNLYLQLTLRQQIEELYQFVVNIFTFLQEYHSYTVFVSNKLLTVGQQSKARGITIESLCFIQLNICDRIINAAKQKMEESNRNQINCQQIGIFTQLTAKKKREQQIYKCLHQIYSTPKQKKVINPLLSIYFYHTVFLIHYYFRNQPLIDLFSQKIVQLLKTIALLLPYLEVKDRQIINQSYYLIAGQYSTSCQRRKNRLFTRHLHHNLQKKYKNQLISYRLLAQKKQQPSIEQSKCYINTFKQKLQLYYNNLQKIKHHFV